MNIEIEHEAFENLYFKDDKIYDKLFDCKTLKGLEKRIKEISEDYQKYNDANGTYDDKEGEFNSGSLKLKGDLFEIFAEIFFKLQGIDNRIMINEYKPITGADDIGVDAKGIHDDDLPAAIQVKFRSDPTYELISDDLKLFPYIAIRDYDVKIETHNKCLVLFTNCKGLHWYTQNKMFKKGIRVIDRNIIKMIDNNGNFWNELRKNIKNNLK